MRKRKCQGDVCSLTSHLLIDLSSGDSQRGKELVNICYSWCFREQEQEQGADGQPETEFTWNYCISHFLEVKSVTESFKKHVQITRLTDGAACHTILHTAQSACSHTLPCMFLTFLSVHTL